MTLETSASKLQVFFAGLFAGVVIMGSGVAFGGWREWSRTPLERAFYDACLLQQHGVVAICDMMVRNFEQAVAQETAVSAAAKQMIADGRSKREVVQWGLAHQLSATALCDAVGITPRELQTGDY